MQIYHVQGKDYCSHCDEYFKNRSDQIFQKKIDDLITKLSILEHPKSWKFYIENNYLECLSNSNSQDIEQMLNSIEFSKIKQAYFIYKVCLEFIDLNINVSVQLGIVSNKDKKLIYQKRYFDTLLNIINENKKITASEIDTLDELLKESEYKVEVHKNAKSPTTNLLEISKNSSFRINSNKSKTIEYKIKSIKQGEVKRIECPVCKNKEILNIDNKDSLFKGKGKNIVVYTCKHLDSKDAKKNPVEISLKDYLNDLDGIDQVDFVIWNHQILFEKFKEDIKNDFS